MLREVAADPKEVFVGAVCDVLGLDAVLLGREGNPSPDWQARVPSGRGTPRKGDTV